MLTGVISTVSATPLQVFEEPEIHEWLLAVGQVASLLSGLIGILIAYVAYRGYRRNDSRPMLYIAAGFGLALGIPFALVPAFFIAPSRVVQGLYVVQTTSQLSGLLLILYALRMRP